MAAALAAAGVDLILVETMNTVREAAAAARGSGGDGAAVVVSCVTDGAGRLLSGEPVEDFARALLALPGAARRPRDQLRGGARASPATSRASRAAAPGVPLAAYGNTFGGSRSRLATTRSSPPEWVRLGARLVGGCCGTTAAHTRAVARTVKGNILGSSSPGASGSSA